MHTILNTEGVKIILYLNLGMCALVKICMFLEKGRTKQAFSYTLHSVFLVSKELGCLKMFKSVTTLLWTTSKYLVC